MKTPPMTRRGVRLLFIVSLVTTASWSASDPFVGEWKLNPSKSTLSDRMSVENVGGNRYAFNFGGGPETIVVDGTAQPSELYPGDSLSVAIVGDGWKVTRKRNGRTFISATWGLSKDGSALTDHFTSLNADGSRYTLTYVYKRKAGGSGFAGTWVGRSEAAVNYILVIQLRPFENDGLAIIDTASQLTGNMNFAAAAVRRVDAHALELMRKKSDGELADFLHLALSPDLETLTMTPHSATADEPRVFVFDRQ